MGNLPSTVFNFSSISELYHCSGQQILLVFDWRWPVFSPHHRTITQSFITFIASWFRVSPALNSLPLISLLSVAAAVSSEAHPVLSDIQPLSHVFSEDRRRERRIKRRRRSRRRMSACPHPAALLLLVFRAHRLFLCDCCTCQGGM